MKKDDLQIGDGGGATGESLPINNGRVNTLVWFEFLIGGQEDLGAVRLAINIDQQDFFAPVGEPCGERNRGRRFSNSSFL